MSGGEAQQGVKDLVQSTPSIAGLIIVVVIGGGLGAAISLAGRPDPDLDLLLWGAVAIALTATAGIAALSGWGSWRALVRLWPGDIRAELGLAATVALLVALAGIVAYVVPDGDPSARGSLLIGVATLGAIPPILAMARVRTIASSVSEGSGVIDLLVSLRRLLVRQLRGLGALVALATMALAVSPFLATMFASDESEGAGAVMLLGGVGSALVALVYVPVAMALRNRVSTLARVLMPINEQDDGKAVVERLAGRQELVKLVMGERGIYDELLASLVVATPLLTAAIGNLLTG